MASAQAFQPPAGSELPNFDNRAGVAQASAMVERGAAVSALCASLPGARVDFDECTGTPQWVVAERGFLCGPGGQGLGIGLAAAVSVGEEHHATKSFLREHPALFGFGPDALALARLKHDAVTKHNGLRTVVWEQEFDGIAIFEGVMISHATKNEELVNLSSHFIPNPEAAAEAGTPNRAALLGSPPILAARAVALAAQNLGEVLEEADVTAVEELAEGPEQRRHFRAPPLNGEVNTKLVWLPLDQNSLRLCWDVELTSRARGEMFRILVDAQTGEALVRHGLTEYLSNASYRVFTSDSPSPFSPACPSPCTTQPPVVARTLVTLSALDTNASPAGWIDDGINETSGNNVDAHTDRDDNNSPDLPRPQGAPFRTFDFPLDLTQSPASYTNAAVTELFFWCNWTHDQLYELGFTESARNFQVNNFGRGGLGNDALQADAQDGGGFNNANMSTPADGSSPRMQMYIFDGPAPDRDGDLDHEIVIHEYVHGLSNRRVGGGVGLSASQSRGMGEGWSDWYALTLLSEPGDDVNGVFAKGGYATYQLGGLTQNYYFGIRRYPYSTDLTKNPLTFRDIDPGQASAHAGIPRSPIIGNTASEVHNQGEVWCVTLWEARANLIAKYGYAVGNQLILQLVTDGMNLSPANPNFLQARDAIMQADLVYNGGADLGELWAAFAKRGMGYSATSPASSTTTGVVEAYDVPDAMVITPAGGLVASGPVGGPFSPNPASFILTNSSSTNLSWSLSSTSTWFTVVPSSGMLAPGSPAATVNVTLTAAVNSLTLGNYTATIRFTNHTSGVVQARAVSLNVVGRSMADDFDPGIDLSQWAAFGGGVGSTVLATNYGGFISSPNSLWFGDGGSRFATTLPINTTAGGTVSFSLRLANGGLSGQWETVDVPSEGVVLEYSLNGGTSWLQFGLYDTTAYYNWTAITTPIPAAARTSATLFRWRQLSHSGTCCDHWALDNVSIDATPTTLLALSLPAVVAEGDLPTNGIATAFPVPSTNLIVALSSSDTSELTVPATVTILAGQSNATFNITIVDDADLDGSQVASLTATATDYASGLASLTILDNETATLAVALPARVAEGGGGTTGTVNASAAPVANIVVSLVSSDLTEIQVPASVLLPAGQTSAVFNVTIVNDTQIDGPQSVTVSAQVPNWTSGAGLIIVEDNEPTNLVVALPASAREGNGVLVGAGTVRIAGTLTTNLGVSLLSGDTTELTVPATATILAGQMTAAFNLTIVDDPDIDSSQSVTVTASAPGFTSGSTNMTVTDDESPPEPFNPSPAHLAANVVQTADLAWQSGALAGETITNDVYFGTNPTPGPAELLGSTTNTTWSLATLSPLTTYYWQIVARKAGVTPGPVWQFTTRGVDHFVWDAISSPQYVGEPFALKVTAKDVFETTVSNFTGIVTLRGLTSGGLPASIIEDFESGTWPHSPWNGGSGGIVSLSYAHDGAYGLSNPAWAYRTDVRLGNVGEALSWWVRPSMSESRAYLGFGASAGGCWSVVVAPNTSQLIIQENLAYQYSDRVVASQNWQTGRWYKVRVEFQSSSAVECKLYDSDGTTLLNSVNYNAVTGLPGGVAIRSFGAFALDTISAGGTGGPIPISPANATPFVNGAWAGDLTVLTLATNVLLRAEDSSGHVGTSAPFAVELRNDISVTLADSPDPVSLGGNLTYTIGVTNIGPAGASDVTVTNVLPATASLVSVATSQGTIATNGNVVTCQLGAMAGNASATVSIVARAVGVGTLTNLVFVTRSDADAYPANNSAVATTAVQSPVLAINDVTLYEGNSGTVNAAFTVTVSPAPALATTVNFATASGSAIAPGDFVSTNGTVTFAPGETNRTLAIAVNGDALYELNESFTVNLSGATNANIADSQGVATILNDDAMPMLSIGDVVVTEGNLGTTNAVFSVNLSAVSGLDVTVYYATANGNATSGSDYVAKSGSLLIPAGSTSTNIVITVNRDLLIEFDEVFYVDLSSAGNAFLLKREGYGLIVNDDGLPGYVDHFIWSSIAAPQYVNHPFGVTITALDAFGNPAVNFNGPAFLGVGNGPGTTNVVGNGTTLTSFPMYAAYHDERTQVIYPAGELGGAGPIAALALDVATVPGLTLSNWTIRIKHTPLTNYSSYVWESAGWTVVHQTNLTVTAGGWVVFPFTTPFDYDGTNSLMIDFSFNNSSSSSAGYCRGTLQSSTRTIHYYTSSAYGDPLTWSGSSPAPYVESYSPNLLLIRGGEAVFLAPGVAGSFTNGVWAGDLTVADPATNLVLRADDRDGHAGNSGAFAVRLYNDVGISVTDTPDPVAVGANLTYAISVTNTGPAAATGVVVVNVLPPEVTLVSVTQSQGTHITIGQMVFCTFGTMSGGSPATVSLLVTPASAGVVTNFAILGRAEADNWEGNNAATNTTVVVVPALTINNVSVVEGNSGTTNVAFTVSLSVPSAQTVSANFATANGSAIAGNDYAATNGTLMFLPGQTNQTVVVQVFGDTNIEPAEIFSVVLSNAVNAVIGVAVGNGTILNDDTVGRVAIFGAPSTDGWNDDVRTKIIGAGNFSQVDSFLVKSGYPVPTLAQLQQYAAVLIYSDAGFNNATSLGNVLADYADAGGGVVACTFSFSISIQGRLNTGGYLPFTIGSQASPGNLTLIKDLPTHEILSRVNAFNGGTASYHNTVGLNAGAVLVAHWSNNQPLVGTKVTNGHRVVGLNFYPPSSSARSDFWLASTDGGLLMANALSWVAQSGQNPPAIVTQPVTQTVTLGGTAAFNVTATGSTPLAYQWRKGGINLVDGGPISGTLSNRLTILNVQTNDAGLYSVAISNLYGAVVSSNATLTVNVPLPPVVPFNPAPTNFAAGVSVHTLLSWSGSSLSEGNGEQAVNGAYGVIDTTGYDADAMTQIQKLPGLTATSVPWTTILSSSGPSLFAAYDVIYFSVNASTTDYLNLRTAVSVGNPLEQYVSLGGTLVLNLAGNNGNQADIGPGGLDYDRTLTHEAESVAAPSHPFITGAGYGGTLLTATMFNNWLNTDHGNLTGLPAGSTELLRNTDGTSMIDYSWGAGHVIASTLTFGWGGSSTRFGPPFSNELAHAASAVVTPMTQYHLYFGTNAAALPLLATNLTQTTHDPGTLKFKTTYYWQVVASNAVGSVTGAVWQFTTTLDEVHFAAATSSVAENGGLATITVTRENPAGGILSVQYATTNGTATAGADYTAVSGTLQFPAGVLSTNFQVPILDDATGEGPETVLLLLSQPSANVLLAAPSNAVLTIVDNDALQVSLLFDPAYVDTNPSTSGEATNVIAALVAKGCQVQPFTGITATAFSNALAGADILYIPELETGDLGLALSAAAKSVISNFVAGGGGLIINGESGSRDENFINQVFGHSIASGSWSSSTVLTGAAAGTAFGGGPASLPENNGTYEWLRSSLPAGSLSIYQDSGALYTTVAVVPRGAGKIVFLAYDWFDAVPRGTQNGGWDEVLRRALLVATPAALPVIAGDGHISAAGQFLFTVNAPRGTIIVVEASTNLVHWTPIHTNLVGEIGNFLFRDLRTGAFARRFYRVRFYEGSLPAPAIHAPVMQSPESGLSSGPRQFSFQVSGVGGQIVVIEVSTNLATWTPIETNTIGIGPIYFRDAASRTLPMRFYRTRLAP